MPVVNERLLTILKGDSMRRIVTSVAALAFVATPISLLAVGGAAPSGAASKPASIVCTKVSGSVTGKVTVSGCTVPKADKTKYASASASVTTLAHGGTLTWSSSKGTTKISKPSTSTTGTACKSVKGTGEIAAKGTVLKGSTAVITPTGQAFAVDVCLNTTSGAISIAPGTKADL
jgi:hypothetical protein